MIFLFILACAFLYALKGGQHSALRAKIENKLGIPKDGGTWYHVAFKFLFLDGKTLSSYGFGLLAGGPFAALGWFIGCSPSMGEEAGGIGGYRGNWHRDAQGVVVAYDPTDEDKARISAAKSGLQRGVFMGAMLTLFTNSHSWLFIVAGATFPICVWLGISLQQRLSNKVIVDWHWYERIYGAVLGSGFLL